MGASIFHINANNSKVYINKSAALALFHQLLNTNQKRSYSPVIFLIKLDT